MDDCISRQAAIDTEGLDAQIRCEMCRNPMHTDRGCDGNCKYDEKLYERIMQILGERIKPLPSVQPEPHWILCSERLPEEHIGFYLVTVQKRRITALNVVGCDNTVHDIDIARWDYDRRKGHDSWHWCTERTVIAWMPLPEPPEEEHT